MQSSQEYGHPHYRKDSMSEDEYIDYVTKLLRMPSVIPDASHIPTAHDGLKNNHTRAEMYNDHQKNNSYMNHSRHQSAPEVNKKVYFIEHERNIEVVDESGKYKIYEEKSIDIEADGFIQKRHQNFDKYGSFRL